MSRGSLFIPSSILLACTLACGARSYTEGPGRDAGPDDCIDRDGDGYGVGAGCIGPDCDDSSADVHEQEDCDERCDDDVVFPGCPCDSPEPGICFTGDRALLGVGICHAGLSVCEGGRWGRCEGEVLPAEEVCNDADDDCDGEVDELVRSPCGTCEPCEESCFGPHEECMDWGEAPGTTETPEGYLTLDPEGVTSHVLWVPNRAHDTVLRVDTARRIPEAAFYSGPNHTAGGWGGAGESPAYVAVDARGDVVVVNQASSATPSITKIAADPDTCPDANRNGRTDTSDDWDDLLPWEPDDDPEDECVLWHRSVGRSGDFATGVVLDDRIGLDGVPMGIGWVALSARQRLDEFDWSTGEATGAVAQTPGMRPEVLALASDGWIWVTQSFQQRVGRFDSSDPDDFETLLLPGGGMASCVVVDENGVPWVGGNDLWRWIEAAERFEAASLPLGFESRVSLAADGEGSIWVGGRSRGLLLRVDADEDMDSHAIPVGVATGLFVAADLDRQVWALGETGRVEVFDMDDEGSDSVLDDCGGAYCAPSPHLLGDGTGLTYRLRFGVPGTWRGVVSPCGKWTHWITLDVDADVPAGSSIVVSVRTARDEGALASEPWTRAATLPEDEASIDLAGVLGEEADCQTGFLEVEAVLRRPRGGEAPTLRRVDVTTNCFCDA